MKDFDKRYWRDTRFRNTGDVRQFDDIISGKKKTALQKLAERYRRFSIIGLVCAFQSVTLMNPNIIPPGPYKTPLICLYIATMLLASAMDNRLCQGIRSIDVSEMTVAEVARMALHYRKRHLQCIAVLLPMAVVFISGIAMMALSTGNEYILAGMVTGGIIGLLVGLNELRKFMSDYREITRE